MSTLKDIIQFRLDVQTTINAFGADGNWLAQFNRHFGELCKSFKDEAGIGPQDKIPPHSTILGPRTQHLFDCLKDLFEQGLAKRNRQAS